MPKSSKKSEESTSKPKKAAARLKAKLVSKDLASKKSKKAPAFRHRKLTKRILRNRVKKVFKNKSKVPRGVVYLGHVPHGFYEDEMREFFSQFGKVTNINIPRSSRTGKYRGFAFVEFYYPEVAKIVAETMNNYLMFQKILQAKYVPPKEQKPVCFRFRKYKTPLLARRRKFLRRQNYRTLTEKENNGVVAHLQKNLEKKKRKLEKLGLNSEFLIIDNEPSPDNDSKITQSNNTVEDNVDSTETEVPVSSSKKSKRRKVSS